MSSSINSCINNTRLAVADAAIIVRDNQTTLVNYSHMKERVEAQFEELKKFITYPDIQQLIFNGHHFIDLLAAKASLEDILAAATNIEKIANSCLSPSASVEFTNAVRIKRLAEDEIAATVKRVKPADIFKIAEEVLEVDRKATELLSQLAVDKSTGTYDKKAALNYALAIQSLYTSTTAARKALLTIADTSSEQYKKVMNLLDSVESRLKSGQKDEYILQTKDGICFTFTPGEVKDYKSLIDSTSKSFIGPIPIEIDSKLFSIIERFIKDPEKSTSFINKSNWLGVYFAGGYLDNNNLINAARKFAEENLNLSDLSELSKRPVENIDLNLLHFVKYASKEFHKRMVDTYIRDWTNADYCKIIQPIAHNISEIAITSMPDGLLHLGELLHRLQDAGLNPQSLSISHTYYSPHDLAILSKFTNISKLALKGAPIINTESGIKTAQIAGIPETELVTCLNQFKGLIELDVSNTTLNDSTLASILGGHLKLEILNLTQCWNITTLPPLPHIKKVVLRDTRITGKGIASLSKSQYLEILNLKGCKSLDNLPTLLSIKDLDLSLTNLDSRQIASLAASVKLKTLNLAGCERVAVLPKFTCIKELNLSRTSVDDPEIASLADYSTLEILNLTNAIMVENLPKLPSSIKNLNLCLTRVSDGVIASLPPKLEALNLSGAFRITDAGVAFLANFLSLKTLDVTNCRLITKCPDLAQVVTLDWGMRYPS